MAYNKVDWFKSGSLWNMNTKTALVFYRAKAVFAIGLWDKIYLMSLPSTE